MFELLLQTSLNALYAASFMALVAVGLVMSGGGMGISNCAHGELYMLGAYCVVALYADWELPFFLTVAVGLVFVGLVGIAMERALFRPMRDNPLGGLVVSIGFLLILLIFRFIALISNLTPFLTPLNASRKARTAP